ncbi:CCA tRNA nucleotidyltransferase [Bacillus badius]|uniref:CCA-adding enzyme n=1 Tax=Bacillus badius TaxID=1455 RepID=A0ABR5AZX1_BACBA|nr:CCA tRNA nucleotidyltransferase [Bacillus badius]KIL79906.1 tRNA nucleotidyltransferase [Bacillus badius]MED4715020.1 CCA tRNA nucleotidyltransferase [Bacillus badius]
MNNQSMFEQAAPLLAELEKAGFAAYYVGGAVRDYLLDRPIGDVDIATAALPEEVKQIFPKTVDVGIEHGTVLVIWKGEGYEITTFRTESEYKDFRRPDKVSFVRTLEEDLQRRDFTMNAMAMDRFGTIIDPFNGREALKLGYIQTVGDANERFSEDALRMMRAARFASQLGFRLHEQTKEALSRCAPLLKHIAVERKLMEMNKLFAGRKAAEGLQVMLEGGLLAYLPGLCGQEKLLEQMLTYDLSRLTASQKWLLLLVLLTPDKPLDWLKAWRMPAKKIKHIAGTYEWSLKQRLCGWSDLALYEAGVERAVDAEAVNALLCGRSASLEELRERHNSLPIRDRKELAVTGQELKAWKNEAGGPWMKSYLERIERAVVEKTVENDPEKIKEWLEACNLL